MLLREGLLKEERVYAESCIFDLDNRGGLGGNGFDAQKNGSTFFRFGADRDELKKALSIELCPVQPLRDMEYEKMEAIVSRSKDLLAPVTRREENNTLACGHFAQFAKAVTHGSKALFPNIADRFGRLSKAHLSSVDEEFKDIIEKGWVQKKLKFGVRAACPWIPALAQRACNASNLVVSHGSEVETIVSILGTVNGNADEAPSLENFEAAAKSIADSSICADYIDACSKIARVYAGGKLGANLIKIDSFAKSLGASARWGEGFTNAIANTPDKSLHHPANKLRIAACVAQLTATNVMDGVYQFFSPQDVKKLLHHSSHQEMEMALEHASDVGMHLEKLGIDAGRINDAERIFMVRTVLSHLERWTENCAKDEFATFDDLKRAFATDVEALLVSVKCQQKGAKKLKNPCHWELAEPKTAPTETTAPQESAIVDNPTSPTYILNALGIKEGAFVKEKVSGKAFKVIAIATDGTMTLQTFNLCEAACKYSVTLEQAVTDWKSTKAVQEQTKVGVDTINTSLIPGSKQEMGRFYNRSCVWSILWDNADDEMDKRLAFFCNPFEMRAASEIPKGELLLLPFAAIADIKDINDVKVDKLPTFHAKCVSEHGTHVIYPPSFSSTKMEGMLVPFYHVIETTADGEANMVWDTWSDPLVESELEITCLKNKRAVKKNELLKVFKAPIPKAEKHTKTVIKEPRFKRARKGAPSASSSTAVEPTRAETLRASVEAAAVVAEASKAKGTGKGKGKGKGRK